MRLVKLGYRMSDTEREKYPITTYEEINMHWYPDEHIHHHPEVYVCVGWAQNGTLRFFCDNGENGKAWVSRAYDYGAYLKKRRLTLPERYNYNPFDSMKPKRGMDYAAAVEERKLWDRC